MAYSQQVGCEWCFVMIDVVIEAIMRLVECLNTVFVQKVNETPEERMARLKKEAQEAEERSKLQMDANRASLQARREREQQYSKLNSVKIHNQWRKIMRMSKVDDLRGQIEVLSQSHEREVDRKDAIIQMLDRDLEDAESQFESAVQGSFQARLPFFSFTRTKANT